jgi:hypothetical protein
MRFTCIKAAKYSTASNSRRLITRRAKLEEPQRHGLVRAAVTAHSIGYE